MTVFPILLRNGRDDDAQFATNHLGHFRARQRATHRISTDGLTETSQAGKDSFVSRTPNTGRGVCRSREGRRRDALARCFVEDGVVRDEGGSFKGVAAIKQWNTCECQADAALQIRLALPPS